MSKFVLDAERHELLKSDNNEPILIEGSLFIRDKISGVVVMTLDTLETRQFFNLNKVDNNSNNCTSSIVLSDADETGTSNTDELNLTHNNSDCTDTELSFSSNYAPAKWTDTNAVRALISNWKNHKNDFKSTNIRNNKVWQMIAYDLKKENPL
nr:PREDICTED: uncharacterized protein LOC105679834 isoform X2 [Linepithema humile]